MELNLSEENELQLQAYLKFAKQKRDQHVRETTSVIRDFRKEKLQSGEMYNFEEASTLFTDLEEEVRALVDKEIQHAYHSNGLLIKLLIDQAENNGVRLRVDTNNLENEVLLKQVARSELAALSRSSSIFDKNRAQLAAAAATDSAPLVNKNKQLQEEKARMEERMQQLQEQVTTFMRERTSLNDQINSLKDQLAAAQSSMQASHAGNTSSLTKLQQDFAALSTQAEDAARVSKAQFEEMERKLNESHGMMNQARRDAAASQETLQVAEKQLQAARDALEGKLQESTQFQQLRKLMQAKSAEVVELRKKLAKYEPQSIPSADD